MIRSVLGLFIFAVGLCAYIVASPGSVPDELPVAAAADVTRAVSESLLPGAALPQIETLASATIAPMAAPAPTNKIRTDDQSISDTTNNVLAGLGLAVTTPISTDPLAALTQDALASIGESTGRPSPPITQAPAPKTALENLVVAALKEGRPDAEIDSMINAAAQSGTLTVPDVLVTSDGRVDTAILLQSIIAQAKIASGGPAPAVPDVAAGDGTGVEVRVVQRAAETEQYRFYTVGRGDSLGAIAIKFYGNVDKFPLIYEANRDILSSPDRITVGQRLAIPNLPKT